MIHDMTHIILKCRLALALIALLTMVGCETEHYYYDARHPEIEITRMGRVTYRGEEVEIDDLPGLLRKSGLSKRDTINIRCADDEKNWRLQRQVMATLSRNGFTRPVLVGERKAYSETGLTAEERRQERLRKQQQGNFGGTGARAPTGGGRRNVRYK